MGLQKNVASQKWRVFAFDTTDGTAATGDAANITAKIAQDWGTRTASNDTNPTETEDGYYLFDLTQAETNGDVLDIYPESATANVQVIGVPGTIFTVPPNFADMGIETDGHVHGDVKQWIGTAVTLGNGAPDVNIQSTDDIDLSATQKASVNAEADTALTDYDAVVPADLPTNFADLAITASTGRVTAGTVSDKTGYSLANDARPTKNVALSNLVFTMVDETDFATPETGLTITAQISTDGGAFGAATNSAAEIGNGAYKINLTQAEMNADTILLRFTAAGAAARMVTIYTQPAL